MNEGARMNRLFRFAWILSVLGAAATGCTLESACKSDFDGDGINDCEDPCPMLQDALVKLGLSSGDVLRQRISESTKCKAVIEAGLTVCTDGDNDGIIDCLDVCDLSPDYGKIVDSKHSNRVLSVYSDELESPLLTCTGEELDLCPNDDSKTVPGLCGCGVSDPSDYEADDKRATCSEQPSQWCPNDLEKQTTGPGVCGCGYKDPKSGRVEDCNKEAQDGFVVIHDTASLLQFYAQVQQHIKDKKCDRDGDNLVCRGDNTAAKCSGKMLHEGGEPNSCCDPSQYTERCDGDVAYACINGKVQKRNCAEFGGCALISSPNPYPDDHYWAYLNEQLAFCNADDAPDELFTLRAKIVNDIDLCDDATVMGSLQGFFEGSGNDTVVYPDLDLYDVSIEGNGHIIRCSHPFARPLFTNVVKSRIHNLKFEYNMVQRPAAVIVQNLDRSVLSDISWKGGTDLGDSQNAKSNAESFGGIVSTSVESVLNGVHADYEDGLLAYKDGGIPQNGFFTSGMFLSAQHSMIKNSGSKIWKYKCTHINCAGFGSTIVRSYVTQSYQSIADFQFTLLEDDDLDKFSASGFVDASSNTLFDKIYHKIDKVRFDNETDNDQMCRRKYCLFNGFGRDINYSWFTNIRHQIDDISLPKWSLFGFVNSTVQYGTGNQFNYVDLIFDYIDVIEFALLTHPDEHVMANYVNIEVTSKIKDTLESEESYHCDLLGQISGNSDHVHINVFDIDMPNNSVDAFYSRNDSKTLRDLSIHIGSINADRFYCVNSNADAERVSCEVGQATLNRFALFTQIGPFRNASGYADVYIQNDAVGKKEYSGAYTYMNDTKVSDAYSRGNYITDRVATTSLMHSYDYIRRTTNAAGVEIRDVFGAKELKGPYLASNADDINVEIASHIPDVYKNTYWYKPSSDAYSAICKKHVLDENGKPKKDKDNNDVYENCSAESIDKLREVTDCMSFTNDTTAELIENLKSQDPGWGAKEIEIRVGNYPQKLNIPWYNVDTSWVGEMKKEMDAWIAEMPIDNGTK